MKFYDYVCDYIEPTRCLDVEVNNNSLDYSIRKRSLQLSIHKMTTMQLFISLLLLFCLTIFFLVLTIIFTDTNITIIIITDILLFASIFLLVSIKRYIYLKTKEPKPYNVNLYNRELPSKLTPAHARFLVFDGLVDSLSLASTILDLVDRGYLKIESNDNLDLFNKELYISRTGKPFDNLFEYEKYLINWFFNEEKVSSTELKNKLKSRNSSDKYAIFQGLITISFPLEKYYRKVKNYKKKRKTFMAIAFYILFFLVICCFLMPVNYYVILICVFISIYLYGNVLFSNPSYFLNQEGVELKDKYLDLKRFLKEFSQIDQRTSEMVVLWNFYLPYSIALGMEGIAYEEINNFFDDSIYYQYENNDELESKERIEKINESIENAKKIYEIKNTNIS